MVRDPAKAFAVSRLADASSGQTAGIVAAAPGVEAFSWLDLGSERLVVVTLADGLNTDCLTPAERAVLEQLLAGASNREIGLNLGRAERTVANQVASIFRKTGVASRRELVAQLQSGLGKACGDVRWSTVALDR